MKILSVLVGALSAVSAMAAAVRRTDNPLPSTFTWRSTNELIVPKDDERQIAAIKDPTIVYHEGVYHVFASTAKLEGYNLVYLNFTDWSEASSAEFYYLDQAPLGPGYRAAPQVFYFEPQKLWYLVYQNDNAAYSTNPDISDPSGWTAPETFYSEMPQIIKDHIGPYYWVDMWVVCDDTLCHLFSSDKYLLLIEAIGTDGRRWFRSWTSTDIAGPWEALAAEEDNPFARALNVEFPEGAEPWTKDISHGELVRSGIDQTLTIDPCNLQFIYQGLAPDADGEYNGLPWRLALLTQTNSAC